MRRLLIVDDDIDIRETLEMVLERRYAVTCACNGAVALELLERHAVDLVLLDLMMPVLDGAGFMAEVTRRGLRVPVVLMSAGTELKQHCHDLGALDYMQKPVSLEALEAMIEKVLGPLAPATIWVP